MRNLHLENMHDSYVRRERSLTEAFLISSHCEISPQNEAAPLLAQSCHEKLKGKGATKLHAKPKKKIFQKERKGGTTVRHYSSSLFLFSFLSLYHFSRFPWGKTTSFIRLSLVSISEGRKERCHFDLSSFSVSSVEKCRYELESEAAIDSPFYIHFVSIC